MQAERNPITADAAEELTAAAELVGGKAWGADKGKPRVYMALPRKDISAYFDYPDASGEKQFDATSALGKPVFKCFIDAPDKPGQWYREEKEKVEQRFAPQRAALLAHHFGYATAAKELAKIGALQPDEFNKVSTMLNAGEPEEVVDYISKMGVF